MIRPKRNPEPIQRLRPCIQGEAGWLAPNGFYYPVERTQGWLHDQIAAQILEQLYHLDSSAFADIADETSLARSEFLWDQGWVRVDYGSIFPERFLTFEQVKTLRQLLDNAGLLDRVLLGSVLSANTLPGCEASDQNRELAACYISAKR